MIPQNQISKLSNRLLKEQGGRRIPENILERDYCIAWFLIGLSHVPVRDKLVFKGGTALRRCYFSEYRFSEDLDFSLLQFVSFEELRQQFELIYDEVKRSSNITFRFSHSPPTIHPNCYTFYIIYEGPLPTASTPKEIKVDITINERIFYATGELAVLKSYEEYTDIPSDKKILVYSLLEIASEKTIALLDRARTEPRDLYDLWYLTEQGGSIILSDCLEGIKAKLTFRGKTIEEVCGEFSKKEARLKKTWNTRLSMQMANLCEFDNVYRSVKRTLRQANITGIHSR